MTSVVDASVVVAYLTGDASGDERAAILGHPQAPTFLDVEVTQTLRGLLRGRRIEGDRADAARTDLAVLRIARHEDRRLLPRAWELRDHCTTYDALYVALAERLEATLVTRDLRLARGVAGLIDVSTG